MDKLRAAAIVLLGLGDKSAADIMQNMSPKEVESVIEAINNIDDISEQDVLTAYNEFFRESHNSSGMDIVSRESVKMSLLNTFENKKIGSLSEGMDSEKAKWIELFKWQSVESTLSMIQDEHPQILAVICTVILLNEKASKVIKSFSREMQQQIIIRMSTLGSISTFAMEALSDLFRSQLEVTEKYNAISVDGVDAVAKIIAYLDVDTEREILNSISTSNKMLTEKIQERIFPFERLTMLDNKSMQVLLKEVPSEDLVMALKGVDPFIKELILKNMSSKAADILKDEIESKGPVKIANVMEAQKRIIVLARKLADEEKIILTTKNDADIVY